MSDVIPRWPKRSLLDDPEEETRAAALIAARRAGIADNDEDDWLGLRPALDPRTEAVPAAESGPFLDYATAFPRPSPVPAGARAQSEGSPPLGRVLLNHHIDTYLATTQGLSERDLRGAAPLPASLSRFALKPCEGNAATIDELRPLIAEEARQLGLEVVVRRTSDTGELGFALRPEASSTLVDDDRPGAATINRAAQIADGLGRFLGPNAAGPIRAGRTVTAGSTAATITLTGRELGEFGDDLKAWIAAGSEVYRTARDAGPVRNAAIGDVRLTGAGLKEMRHTGADVRKWQLMPVLPQIIRSGVLVNTTAASGPRPDHLVKFHWLEANVVLNGKPLRVGINVGVDAQGGKFYNLNEDLDKWGRRYQGDGINLHILGPAILGAARAEERRDD